MSRDITKLARNTKKERNHQTTHRRPGRFCGLACNTDTEGHRSVEGQPCTEFPTLNFPRFTCHTLVCLPFLSVASFPSK